MPDGISSLEGRVLSQNHVGRRITDDAFLRMLERPARPASVAKRTSWCCSLLAAFLISVAAAGHAQNLNWEGQTGAFVTPFAYTSPSPAKGFGLPAVSFHYLDGGSVLGGFYEVSGTVGI